MKPASDARALKPPISPLSPRAASDARAEQPPESKAGASAPRPRARTDASARRSLLRAAGGLLAGIGLAVAFEGAGAQGPALRAAAGERVRAWVADRDGQQVVGLTPALHIGALAPLRWPVRVEARPGGGCWVACSVQGQPLGPHRAVVLSANGQSELELPLGAPWDIFGEADGSLLWLELGLAGAPERLWRASPAGALLLLAELPGARAVAARGDRVLVGTNTGRVSLLDAQGFLLQEQQLGGQIGDLGCGPVLDQWWALDVEQQGRVQLLAADLSSLWSAPVGLQAQGLAAVPASEQVWSWDTSEPWLRRFGPGGALQLSVQSPAQGLSAADAEAGGSLWVASAGSVLVLAPDGTWQASQGGFSFATDVALAW